LPPGRANELALPVPRVADTRTLDRVAAIANDHGVVERTSNRRVDGPVPRQELGGAVGLRRRIRYALGDLDREIELVPADLLGDLGVDDVGICGRRRREVAGWIEDLARVRVRDRCLEAERDDRKDRERRSK